MVARTADSGEGGGGEDSRWWRVWLNLCEGGDGG
ncbi:unnamed protein product [Brassica oleracea]